MTDLTTHETELKLGSTKFSAIALGSKRFVTLKTANELLKYAHQTMLIGTTIQILDCEIHNLVSGVAISVEDFVTLVSELSFTQNKYAIEIMRGVIKGVKVVG